VKEFELDFKTWQAIFGAEIAVDKEIINYRYLMDGNVWIEGTNGIIVFHTHFNKETMGEEIRWWHLQYDCPHHVVVIKKDA
jgi:hypothetical protein